MKKIIVTTLLVAMSVFVCGGMTKVDAFAQGVNKQEVSKSRIEESDIKITDLFTLHGDAELIDDQTVRLTKDEFNQLGAITLNSQIDFSEKFKIELYIDLGYKSSGFANGIGFAFHDGKTNEVGLSGIDGSGLGILGLKNGLGFEFDTYMNPGVPEDTTGLINWAHHVFVHTDWYDYLNPIGSIKSMMFSLSGYDKAIIEFDGEELWLTMNTSSIRQNISKDKASFILAATTANNYSAEHKLRIGKIEATLNIPQLEANDIEIQQDEIFNPFDKKIGLKAYDKNDGDLTNKIKAISNNVNSAVPGTYNVTYEVKNNRGDVARKTIDVKVNVKDTWPEGKSNGWKMFAGQDIELQYNPDEALVGDYTFFSTQHAGVYKHFTGTEALEQGKEYRVTVYVKPENEKPAGHRLKVSLKEDPSSKESRELINAFISDGTLAEKGYYRMTSTFKLGAKETDPLIVIENFNAGYIGSINVSKIN
ncbi:lectin-like domain-containing protein [Enterococcus sp. 5H]|uniref:lectin-like domain-containing protein n=1 Tax=Enterococcus sp. 5H TaxID=1229490 RepID=UPI002303E989|nr:immunoglobulin-like domain-containing protein [Enterococcus sp. 5H]MDA9470076.1 putative cell-wall-anchored protein SasA (LPXTG motif) [Enterococcus sp. 5H]